MHVLLLLQDDILVPFENVLNFSRFAIRLPRAKLPQLPQAAISLLIVYYTIHEIIMTYYKV